MSIIENLNIDTADGSKSMKDTSIVPAWQEKSLFPYWSLPKNKALTERAKKLRKQGIASEVIFWKVFKNKENICGWDIDRQVIIGNYIVDFFIAELGVVIEIDGSSHDGRYEYDIERENYLRGLNLEIIRYSDRIIRSNIQTVSTDLQEKIKARIQTLESNIPLRQATLAT